MMEYYPQLERLVTSLSIVWILTMTSSTRATSFGKLSLSNTNRSQPFLTSLLSMQSSSLSSTGEHAAEKCCENGGVCVMGVFCHCPEQFYGFRCEYEIQKRPCGPLKHAQWARMGCSLCRCFDSNLMCLSGVYSGCDNEPDQELVDPEVYQGDIEIFPMDKKSKPSDSTPENDDTDFYNYDYGDYYTTYSKEDESSDNNIISNSSGKTQLSRFYSLTFPVCLILCLFNWTRTSRTEITFIS